MIKPANLPTDGDSDPDDKMLPPRTLQPLKPTSVAPLAWDIAADLAAGLAAVDQTRDVGADNVPTHDAMARQTASKGGQP